MIVLKTFLVALVALATALSLAACTGSGYALTLQNDSGVPLHIAAVVADPPPQRWVVTSETIANGARYDISNDARDPLFYDPVSKLSVAILFDWSQQFPIVLTRVMKHVVPPGEEGSDPREQPKLLLETPFEVNTQSTRKSLEVEVGPVARQMPVIVRQL